MNTLNRKLIEAANKREVYKELRWLSTDKTKTKIVEMSDDYLLNALRKVHSKLELSKAYPLIEEFQSYNNIKYKDWAAIFYNEYIWRKETEENEYRECLNMEIHRQSARDREEWGSWDQYGECF